MVEDMLRSVFKALTGPHVMHARRSAARHGAVYVRAPRMLLLQDVYRPEVRPVVALLHLFVTFRDCIRVHRAVNGASGIFGASNGGGRSKGRIEQQSSRLQRLVCTVLCPTYVR